MSRIELRAEDVLNVAGAVGLLTVAAVRMGTPVFHLIFTEDAFWDIAYIVLPVACFTFAASWRYAFRPRGGNEIGHVSSEWWHVLRDWSPFLIFSVLYSSMRLDMWTRIAPVDRDVMLLHWDRVLLGETPPVWLEHFITPRVTSMMALAYALHVILPPLFAVAWYRRDLFVFRWMLLAIVVSGIIGVNGYLIVPAVGPGTAFPSLFHRNLGGGLYMNAVALLDTARAHRDAFPSLHVGISTLVLWFAWKHGRVAFWTMLPLVIANWISTMYLRYHYFVDVIAGWITAAASIALAWVILQIERKVLSWRDRRPRLSTIR